MTTFGQRLLHVTRRDRWLLFSALIECNGARIPALPENEISELEKPFQHPFFQESRKNSSQLSGEESRSE